MGEIKNKIILSFVLCGLIFPRVLRYMRAEVASSLDPAAQWNLGASEVLANIFEGLVTFKGDRYEVVPLLATKWEVKEEGKRWIFYLRRGVKFHDGTEFDADSVVYSFKRQIENKSYTFSVFFPFLTGIKKIDKYTVEITQSKPYPLLLYALANPVGYILSPASKKGGSYKPIGTGPFMFKGSGKDGRLLLVSNPDYWGGKPRIEGVVFYSMGNPSWRILQLKNGNVDIVRVSSVKEHYALKNYPQIKFIIYSLMDINYLIFNSHKPPFNRRKAREAVAHLMDKKRLVRLIFQDLAIPAVTLLPPYLKGFNPLIHDYGYNPEKARKLLVEAGYPGGFKCTLYISKGRTDLKELLLKFIRSAKRVGVDINLIVLPYNQFIRETRKGKHNMVAFGWVADMPDPDNFLYPLFARKQRGVEMNYYNKKLAEILEKARVTPDNDERLKLYMEAQEIIYRDVALIPLYHSRKIIAYNKNIKGLKVSPKGYVIFKDAELVQ